MRRRRRSCATNLLLDFVVVVVVLVLSCALLRSGVGIGVAILEAFTLVLRGAPSNFLIGEAINGLLGAFVFAIALLTTAQDYIFWLFVKLAVLLGSDSTHDVDPPAPQPIAKMLKHTFYYLIVSFVLVCIFFSLAPGLNRI